MSLVQKFGMYFPKLTEHNARETSPETEDYNCIAYAAGDTLQWWWPDPLKQRHWPLPDRTCNIDGFVRAYATVGYAPSDTPDFELGCEKIALYANAKGPQHAAIQISERWWGSKLGPQVDIEHEADALTGGPEYGDIVLILSRRARSIRDWDIP